MNELRYRRALEWIAEYGSRDGDLLEGHEEAMRNIARNALRFTPVEPELPPPGPFVGDLEGIPVFEWTSDT